MPTDTFEKHVFFFFSVSRTHPVNLLTLFLSRIHPSLALFFCSERDAFQPEISPPEYLCLSVLMSVPYPSIPRCHGKDR